MTRTGRRLARAGNWPVAANYPNATSTGPVAGTTFTTVGTGAGQVSSGTGWTYSASANSGLGQLEVTGTNGVTLQNLIIGCNLDITGASTGSPITGITIKNCLITGLGGSGTFGISLRHTSGCTIQNCAVSGQDAGTGRILVGIKDIYADSVGQVIKACNISFCSTGIQLEQGLLEGNYIHDLGFISGDHINGITSNGGGGGGIGAISGPLTIRHNTVFTGYSQTDAISLFEDFGVQYNRVIENNLMAGGGYALYAGQNSGGFTGGGNDTHDIVVQGNRFSTLYYSTSGVFGPVTDFWVAGPGNAWCRNVIHETGAVSDSPGTSNGSTLTETWAQFSTGTGWTDGNVEGSWDVVFASAGTVGIETDTGANVYTATPQAPGASSYSVLTTSVARFSGDLDVTVAMKTVSQSRTPTPNAWERAWFLWNYTDNLHFYYILLKATGWELGKEDPAYAGNQRFLATGTTPTFAVGSWNTVEVAQAANVITIHVDSTLLTAFTDTERPYTSGNLGLYCEDSHARFGDITMTGA